MKLVIMTRPTFFVEEDKIMEALFEEGMDNLHLYKPGSSPLYLERLLSLLPEDLFKRITVHEHYYLKNEFSLGAIHIDHPTAPPPDGYKGHFCRTCSEVNQLRDAKKKARYVFLRTIFDSFSEKDMKCSHTLDQLHMAARQGLIDKKVYALGGVGLNQIPLLRDLGFGGVVICGDLWNRFDIHNQTDYREVISHFEKLRKATS